MVSQPTPLSRAAAPPCWPCLATRHCFFLTQDRLCRRRGALPAAASRLSLQPQPRLPHCPHHCLCCPWPPTPCRPGCGLHHLPSPAPAPAATATATTAAAAPRTAGALPAARPGFVLTPLPPQTTTCSNSPATPSACKQYGLVKHSYRAFGPWSQGGSSRSCGSRLSTARPATEGSSSGSRPGDSASTCRSSHRSGICQPLHGQRKSKKKKS